MLSGLASTAHAELIEYTFTSAQGKSRTVPARQHYVNPQGDIKFALSAGVDRKVKISILNDKSKSIDSREGKILGAEDRIIIGGASYYGEVLTLTAPAEGAYTLKAEILSGDGKNTIQSDEYPFVVDVTKPVINGPIIRDFSPSYPWTINIIGNISHGGTNEIYLSGVSDALSGLTEQAKMYAIDNTGNRLERDVRIANGTISTTTYETVNSIMPIDRAAYTVGFKVTDRAGNYAESSQIIKADKNPPPFFELEIFNEKTKEWEKYSSGMTIYSNPVRVRDVTYKADHTEFNGTDYGWWGSGADFSKPGIFAYREVVGLIPADGSEYREYHNKAGSYILRRFADLNFTFGPGVNLAPKTKNIEAKIGDKWVSIQANERKPYSISAMRGTVEKRNYVQRLAIGGHECTVPVGQESCIMNFTKTFTTGRSYEPYAMASGNNDKSWWQHAGYFYNNWDFNNPVIEEINYVKDEKKVLVNTYDPDTTTDTTTRYTWSIASHRLTVTSKGKETTLTPSSSIATAHNRWHSSFNVSALEDGQYTVKATAVDSFGNEGERLLPTQITVDNTPPKVTIHSPETISSLDQITIDVVDTNDINATLADLKLTGGPAHDQVNLAWSESSKGRFNLEYPIIFPTLQEGEEYTLTAIAKDGFGNSTTKSSVFIYEPSQVSLAGGMDGKIYLPSVTNVFNRNNGLSVISTEPVKLGGGETILGTYDVIVSSRSDSEVAVVINGRIVQPGDTSTVAAQHNFSTTGGRIDVPAMAAENGKTGKAYILLTTSAPNSPVAVVELNFWDAEVNLQSDTWTYRQVIDPLDIRALPAKGTMCRLSLSEPIAQKADPISDPVCLLEWTQIPDEAEIAAIKAASGSDRVVGLQGQAVRVGQQDIKYTLYMYSGDSKIRVGGGSGAIDVVSAVGAITFEPTENHSEVFRKIQSMTLKLKQGEGPKCRLTNNAEEAIRYGASSTSNSKACYLEWMSYPSTLEVGNTTDPMLYGYLNDHKKEEISWRLSIYSKVGTRVSLGSQTYEINVINPPVPTIEMNSRYWIDGQLVVPSDVKYIGDAVFVGEPADMTVQIKRDDVEVEREDYISGLLATPNKVNRMIEMSNNTLWGVSELSLSAFYTKLPDVLTKQTINVISAPPQYMDVDIQLDSNKTLDTVRMPMTVSVFDGSMSRNDVFDAAKHGKWKVRAYQQQRAGSDESKKPLTDYVELNEHGKAVLEIDMSAVEGDSAKIQAEAVLLHEVDGYSRVLESRAAFVTVMYGGDVTGKAVARKLSGPAPYSAYFQFAPDTENRRAAKALGEVSWEVSDDDGLTWESTQAGPRPVFSRTFDKGTYLLKATSTNRHSGAKFTSEVVEIVAYDKPKSFLVGPKVALVGDTATFTVKAMLNGEDSDAANYAYFWSTDKGVTFVEGDNTFIIKEDIPTSRRLMVRVRAKEAPLDDRQADDVARTNVTFKPITGPRVGLTVPNKVEVGKTYTFKALARPPFAGMQGEIKGFFTLPDGTTVENDSLEYTPNSEDESAGRVNVQYTAYIEGFRDAGAETTRATTMRVWEYVWPEFKLSVQGANRFAPSKLNLNVHQVASALELEQPVYIWEFPEGTQVITERDGRAEVIVTKVGESVIRVTVQDGRGHSSEVEEKLHFDFAEPFVVEMPIRASNELMRETVTVTVRPSITGGHPKDRVAERKFFLNGELLQEGGTSARADLDAGKHVLGFELLSRYGQVSQGVVEFEVNANKIPVCTLGTKDVGSSLRLLANCVDEDGRISQFKWLIDGVESGKAKTLSLVKSKIVGNPTVTVTAFDDSGAESEPVSLVVSDIPEEEVTEPELPAEEEQLPSE